MIYGPEDEVTFLGTSKKVGISVSREVSEILGLSLNGDIFRRRIGRLDLFSVLSLILNSDI